MTNQSSSQISVRQMARLLKKFSVKSGDILAIKHLSENANKEAIEKILRALEQNSINALVIVVNDFDDMKVLNDTEMNKRGWFRLDSLKKLSASAVAAQEKKEAKDD
jgi:hypothetical protein